MRKIYNISVLTHMDLVIDYSLLVMPRSCIGWFIVVVDVSWQDIGWPIKLGQSKYLVASLACSLARFDLKLV